MALTSKQAKELKEVLDLFGLNDRDQKVYLQLLKSGKTTVTPLAKSLMMPLTTVNSVVERLNTFGLILVSRSGARRSFQAHDPKVFKNILKQRETDVNNILPLLEKLKENELLAEARLRLYSRSRITEALDLALECRSKVVYEIVSARDFQALIGERYHFTKKRVAKSIRLKSLRVQAKEIKKYSRASHYRELRDARFLPHTFTFNSSIMFWDNTVAMFTSQHEGSCVTIESESLVLFYRQMFEFLWEFGKKMENKVE